jgi:UDP-N-acetyl-D-mannosaminuronic acid transferase (WecB/TagA/CpsF family)
MLVMKDKQLKFLNFLSQKGIDSNFDVKDVITNTSAVTFINPMSVNNFTDEYISYLYKFDKIYSDGQLLTNFYSKNFKDVGRYSFDGNSIAPIVFDYIKKNKLNLALIGSTQENVETTGRIISRGYELIGIHTAAGYDLDVNELAKALKVKKIDVAILGLGQIKQEKILLELKEMLPQLTCFTCGGYIHQVAGKGRLKYYPDWVNKLHLRAPYRVCDEGYSLFKRYLFDYADFYQLSFRFKNKNHE